RRYSSVAELAADIRCVLQGRPIGARPDALVSRGSRFVRRNPRMTAAALTSAALAVSIMWEFKWQPFSGATARGAIQSIAVLPLEDLSGDPGQEHLADGMTDNLIGDLSKIRSLRIIGRDSMMHYKGANKPAAA